MEPLLTNSQSNKCAEGLPSNCVIYNGRKIDCINTCTGDTVSDIEYKLGQQLCYIQSLLTLTSLDISCFYTPCPSCTAPTSLLENLQFMANEICTQKSQIAALSARITALGG